MRITSVINIASTVTKLDGVSVFKSVLQTTVHPIDFMNDELLRTVLYSVRTVHWEEDRTVQWEVQCSVGRTVQCEVVWMSGTQESCEQQHQEAHQSLCRAGQRWHPPPGSSCWARSALCAWSTPRPSPGGGVDPRSPATQSVGFL